MMSRRVLPAARLGLRPQRARKEPLTFGFSNNNSRSFHSCQRQKTPARIGGSSPDDPGDGMSSDNPLMRCVCIISLCAAKNKKLCRDGLALCETFYVINLNFSPFPVPFSPIYSPLRNAPNGHAYHKGVEVYDKGYKNTNICTTLCHSKK